MNGREAGIAWTGPNELEITEAVQAGENQIAIMVANQLHNRLVGDAQVECAAYDKTARAPLSETPSWLPEGLPSPGGRYLFTGKSQRAVNVAEWACRQQGVPLPWGRLPEGIEVSCRQATDRRLHVICNHGAQDCSLRLPFRAADALTGKPLGDDITIPGNNVLVAWEQLG